MSDDIDITSSDLNRSRRQDWITEYIMQHGSVTVDELCEIFKVSRMTIHRDLDELEKQIILRKVRGGASALPSPLFESDIRYRDRMTKREKESIAKAALTYVEPGQAIMVDDSTTTRTLVKLLPAVKPLTVITNCLGIMNELREEKGIRLISLGGDYNRRYDAFTGLLCESSIASLRVNTLFMSTSAVSGLLAFHQEQDIVKVKQAMMLSASKRILMIDHTKLGKVALHRLAILSDFDLVIVDSDIDAACLDELRNAKVNVEIA